jgi:cation diffusion facilitator CzcD-associated flavoprotein CzcO
LDHIHACARHFQLESHIKLQQECVSIQWSAEEGLWACLFRDLIHDKTYEVKARYVVTAMGVLSTPNGLDDLPVLKHFGGQVFHTAEWRKTDFDRKRVMVIGNGCSANQVIPWILNEQKPQSLVQIVRSEQWVAPKNNYRINNFTKWSVFHISLISLGLARLISKQVSPVYPFRDADPSVVNSLWLR